MKRIFIVALCATLLMTIACSSGTPTSPTGAGATISGTVVRAAVAPSTVSVAGTTISSAIDAAGAFQLGGVPTGDVQLVFGGAAARPTVSLSNVADQEVIELQVAIVGGTATVEREVRGSSAGKLVLCHRSDDNGYHSIEVSVNAESAHRAHGDARPGEAVPADLSKVFDDACRLSSPVEIKKFTNDQDADEAPGPTIPVGGPVSWTYVITNKSLLTFTSLSVTDDRGVDVACPRMLPAPGASLTCNASGTAVAGQYRNVGTVTVTADGRRYTASDASHYFGGTLRGVIIQKYTNGQDVSQAPGPSIPVGSPVEWTYVITNRTLSQLTSLSVTDDRGVEVACPRILPPPGASVTCTGSGRAVAGQYRNVGTVVATADGTRYTDADDSFYFGQEPVETQRASLCHRTGNGSFHMIEVSVNAEPAHRGHGDGKVGEAVPGSPGRVFTASCGVQ